MGAREKETLRHMSLLKSVSKIRTAVLTVVLCVLIGSGCRFSTTGDVTPPPGQTTAIPAGDQYGTVAPTIRVEMDNQPGPAIMQPAAEVTVQPSDSLENAEVIFTGEVANESGGQVPDGLVVTLQVFKEMELASTETTDLQTGGRYRFDPQPVEEDRLFRLFIEYDGLVSSTEIIDPFSEGLSGEYRLDFLIYDKTTSTEGLVIDRAHLFVTSPTDDTLQVVVFLLVTNPTRMVVTAEEGESVLNFSVPENAVNLQADDGGMSSRFLFSSNGFGDTLSIYPGVQKHEILYSFELPYTRGQTLSLDFPLPVQGGTLILPVGFTLRGNELKYTGEREMSTGTVRLYDIEPLKAGQPLDFTVSGRARTAGLSTGALTVIGASAFALVVLISWLWLRRKTSETAVGPTAGITDLTPLEQNKEHSAEGSLDPNGLLDENGLLDAIIALDHEFEEGRMAESEYRQRREQLKDRLRQIRAH